MRQYERNWFANDWWAWHVYQIFNLNRFYSFSTHYKVHRLHWKIIAYYSILDCNYKFVQLRWSIFCCFFFFPIAAQLREWLSESSLQQFSYYDLCAFFHYQPLYNDPKSGINWESNDHFMVSKSWLYQMSFF